MTSSSGPPFPVVTFVVQADKIRPWELLFVVGNRSKLGNWNPAGAVELIPDDSGRIWRGSITDDAPHTTGRPLFYRYFVGYYLQADSDPASKIRIITSYESQLLPRSQVNFHVKETCDVYGSYNAKSRISLGPLSHPLQNEMFFRLHGNALKFFKERYNKRPYYIKMVAFDVRRKEEVNYKAMTNHGRVLWRMSSVYNACGGSIDDDEPEQPKDAFPMLPSFSSTETTDLFGKQTSFHDQGPHGVPFQNDLGYIVFRTTSIAPEHLAFRVEFSVDRSVCPAKQPGNKKTGIERVAIAYVMPSSLTDSFGITGVPILAMNQQPLGELIVDYLFIRAPVPFIPPNLEVSYARHWKRRKAVEVGHRGMGNSYTKFSASRENTINSLNKAARNGADYVEFDVQLTKDKIPVIYHDFHVLVSVAMKHNGSSNSLSSSGEYTTADGEQPDSHELAIKDLKLQQLRLLHLSHSNATANRDKLQVTADATETFENQPFPTLVDVLQHVDSDAGFNIEVKYPMMQKNGVHECENYQERNTYVDRILSDIFAFAGKRRILFSSFDPDICSMISLKQNKYPVLFLCVGVTTRYVPFLDLRCSTSEVAVNYAASLNLLGVNFHSEELLRDTTSLERAKELGLVSFVWGDDLDLRENVEKMRQLGLNGIIYDKIGELVARSNIFTVERRARSDLFGSPSSGRTSRLGSLNHTPSGRQILPHAVCSLDISISRQKKRENGHFDPASPCSTSSEDSSSSPSNSSNSKSPMHSRSIKGSHEY